MSPELMIDRRDRVSVVAPHPDDETLAAGGLLQQAVAAGATVQVLLATDGDNNPWAQRASEGRWTLRASDHDRWGMRRRGEVAEALRRLGVPLSAVTFLGFRDQGLTDALLTKTEDVMRRLARALATFRPTLVVAPAMADRHPDHSALAVLARLALMRMATDTNSARVLSYLVHPPSGAIASARERCVRLTGAQVQCKRSAILAHRSQLRLRRRALLDFAQRNESFLLARPDCWRMPGGPVRRARVDGGRLHIALVRSRHLGVFGFSMLRILTAAADGCHCWQGPLPLHDGAVQLASLGGTQALAGRFVGDRHGGELILPARILTGAHAAFLKIQRRFGFLDESGWSELPLARLLTDRASGAPRWLGGDDRQSVDARR